MFSFLNHFSKLLLGNSWAKYNFDDEFHVSCNYLKWSIIYLLCLNWSSSSSLSTFTFYQTNDHIVPWFHIFETLHEYDVWSNCQPINNEEGMLGYVTVFKGRSHSKSFPTFFYKSCLCSGLFNKYVTQMTYSSHFIGWFKLVSSFSFSYLLDSSVNRFIV